MNWSDEKILSTPLWDVKERIIITRLNKLLAQDQDFKKYLETRYIYWNNSYKDVINLIKKGYSEWPKCPTCGKYINNIKHTHCSVRCSSLDPCVQTKLENSLLDIYGVTNAYNIPENRIKAQKAHRETIDKKYGSWSNFSKHNQSKANETRKEKAQEDPNYWKNIKEKEKTTRQKKLTEDPDYNKKIKDKEIETKRQNGTLNTSKGEEITYETLCKLYGSSHVFREYNKDNRYPFHCDFYIDIFDLFIELNLYYTHNCRWFNPTNPNDLLKLTELKKKNSFGIIDAWSIRDKQKREIAERNNLNYKTIWTNKELILWLSEITSNPNILYKKKYIDWKL